MTTPPRYRHRYRWRPSDARNSRPRACTRSTSPAATPTAPRTLPRLTSRCRVASIHCSADLTRGFVGIVARAIVAALGLHLFPIAPRIVHELELHPVGIGEEHGVVLASILRILGGSIEDGDLFAGQEAMKLVHVDARAGSEREMMESDPVAIELGAPI